MIIGIVIAIVIFVIIIMIIGTIIAFLVYHYCHKKKAKFTVASSAHVDEVNGPTTVSI